MDFVGIHLGVRCKFLPIPITATVHGHYEVEDAICLWGYLSEDNPSATPSSPDAISLVLCFYIGGLRTVLSHVMCIKLFSVTQAVEG